MQNCPHCAEKISAAARVCKHCKRECLYHLEIEGPLQEKQIYALAKYFVEHPVSNFAPLSLTDAKLALEKLPLKIGDQMSFAEVRQIQQNLHQYPLRHYLSEASPFQENEKSHWFAQLAYGMAAILILGVSLFYFWKNPAPQQSENSEVSSLTEPSLDTHAPTENSPNYPSNPDGTAQALSREQMLQLLDSTVSIQGPKSIGSGFFISADGYILSNSHVTTSMSEPLITLRNGQQYKAEKIGENKKLDISLLKIKGNSPFTYLRMGDAHSLYPGQNIITIGNPSGLAFTVTRGIVSFVGREIDGVQYIQTDAAINPGNSGGPMISSDLKVVGINTLTAKVEKGISFALPINYAYSAGGLAEGIGNYPRTAQSFNTRPKPAYQTAALANESEAFELPADTYQKEAESYKEQLEKIEADILKRAEDLKSKIERLQTEYSSASGELSQRQRLKQEIEKLSSQHSLLPNEVTEARIRYYRQVIAVLQRQKGDQRFSSLSSKIDAQIDELQTEKKRLEQSLSP